ncbi:hypothetical protein HPB52_012418 [Rhipicephalus sanguineus]|uniref:Uncharacterized protein n=1 Tax=Rhipicephalus sanguineus TaxID=34632 RepID=A0A9D4YP80_RHISA|nr:hypothetical protein HPB52_012418 [Rhipicephalus sanguineus]
MQRAAGGISAESALTETDLVSVESSEVHRSTLNSSDPDAATRLREKELDLEMLRMQIRLQTLRLQEQGIYESEGGRRAKLSSYAKDLRAVLPTIPESDYLAPAWFKSAESMPRSCDIPQDAAGAIIVPFLNEKSRTLVANKSEDRVLSYNEIRELVLSELKLTPQEYKRRFYTCRKGKESWGQFVTQLDITLDYYLRSRNVKTLEELRALMISDRVKEMLSHERVAQLKDETQRKEGNDGASVLVVGSTEGSRQDKTEGLGKEESPLNSPEQGTAEPVLAKRQGDVEKGELAGVDNILDPSNEVAVYSDEKWDELLEYVDEGLCAVKASRITVKPSNGAARAGTTGLAGSRLCGHLNDILWRSEERYMKREQGISDKRAAAVLGGTARADGMRTLIDRRDVREVLATVRRSRCVRWQRLGATCMVAVMDARNAA